MKEAEGYKLHLSLTNPTGYLGVRQEGSDRYSARYSNQHIGMFDTAVEAAVAYAKAVEAKKEGEAAPKEKKEKGEAAPKEKKEKEKDGASAALSSKEG